MGEQEYVEFDDILPEQQSGELVHWMDPRPLAFGPGAISLAVAGAFALGLGAAAVAFALARLVRTERRMSLPLERRLRRLH